MLRKKGLPAGGGNQLAGSLDLEKMEWVGQRPRMLPLFFVCHFAQPKCFVRVDLQLRQERVDREDYFLATWRG